MRGLQAAPQEEQQGGLPREVLRGSIQSAAEGQGFENFMHKKKGWDRLSEAEKVEYRALHDEFVARSSAMLKEYERSGSEKIELEIKTYIELADRNRNELENRE